MVFLFKKSNKIHQDCTRSNYVIFSIIFNLLLNEIYPSFGLNHCSPCSRRPQIRQALSLGQFKSKKSNNSFSIIALVLSNCRPLWLPSRTEIQSTLLGGPKLLQSPRRASISFYLRRMGLQWSPLTENLDWSVSTTTSRPHIGAWASILRRLLAFWKGIFHNWQHATLELWAGLERFSLLYWGDEIH